MDAKRAAEVLRHESHWASETEATACTLGAQALEAWAWVERTQGISSDLWAWLGCIAYGHGKRRQDVFIKYRPHPASRRAGRDGEGGEGKWT